MDVDSAFRSKPLVEPEISHELYMNIEPNLNEETGLEIDEGFTSVCLFPWTMADFRTMWGGSLPAQTGHDGESSWALLIEQFADVALLGGMGTMTICSTYRNHFRTASTFAGLEHHPVLASGWALRKSDPFVPLAVFSLDAYIFIHDVVANKLLSALRGHGGRIHSIAVHPSEPHLFCSTSRDFTTRIYNLHLKAANNKDDIGLNPLWSAREHRPSKGGAPHGLRASEPEGLNPQANKLKAANRPAPIGRCVKILVGSRASGHQQPVICAAWHPNVPCIATGGLDRAVKIWRTSPLPEDGTMAREDKPLWSCVELHRAGVMSIAWVGEDTLITHDRPALMDSEGDHEPGAVVLWKWNSLRRFFPLGHDKGWQTQPDLVGVAADFLESSSFEIIARLELPPYRSTLGAKVYNHRHLYPVLVIPLQHNIRLMTPHELPLYDRRDAIPPLEGEDDAAIINDMGNLNLAGASPQTKETACIMDDETTLIAVDVAIAGRLIVSIDENGRAWVWIGSCDFAWP